MSAEEKFLVSTRQDKMIDCPQRKPESSHIDYRRFQHLVHFPEAAVSKVLVQGVNRTPCQSGIAVCLIVVVVYLQSVYLRIIIRVCLKLNFLQGNPGLILHHKSHILEMRAQWRCGCY